MNNKQVVWCIIICSYLEFSSRSCVLSISFSLPLRRVTAKMIIPNNTESVLFLFILSCGISESRDCMHEMEIRHLFCHPLVCMCKYSEREKTFDRIHHWNLLAPNEIPQAIEECIQSNQQQTENRKKVLTVQLFKYSTNEWKIELKITLDYSSKWQTCFHSRRVCVCVFISFFLWKIF